MKNVKNALALLLLLLVIQISIAQEEAVRPEFVVVSTAHWNFDYDNSDTSVNWLDLEKMYHENVTMKNDLILTSGVLTHLYTADNSEVLFFTTYASWDDIEKAQDRDGELMEAAWPDEAERDSLNSLRNAFYTNYHSDEIYATVPGAKVVTEASDEPMIFYVRVSERAFPDDGSNSEWNELRQEYTDKIYAKDELVKGYYPSVHAWGADGTDYVEVMLFNSVADMDASGDSELFDAAWPEMDDRRAFFKKLNNYTTPKHRDYIYSSVPELMK